MPFAAVPGGERVLRKEVFGVGSFGSRKTLSSNGYLRSFCGASFCDLRNHISRHCPVSLLVSSRSVLGGFANRKKELGWVWKEGESGGQKAAERGADLFTVHGSTCPENDPSGCHSWIFGCEPLEQCWREENSRGKSSRLWSTLQRKMKWPVWPWVGAKLRVKRDQEINKFWALRIKFLFLDQHVWCEGGPFSKVRPSLQFLKTFSFVHLFLLILRPQRNVPTLFFPSFFHCPVHPSILEFTCSSITRQLYKISPLSFFLRSFRCNWGL